MRSLEKIHERHSLHLPINSVVSVAIVDDPYSLVGEKLEVLRSVRDDPLAGMYSRRQIDSAQFVAGRQWQQHYEAAEIGAMQAIDPARPAVDGGRIPEPITDRQIRALRELALADKKLGSEGCALVRDVLGFRLSIHQVAEKRQATAQREIDYLGRRFRECLETLAALWGFTQPR